MAAINAPATRGAAGSGHRGGPRADVGGRACPASPSGHVNGASGAGSVAASGHHHEGCWPVCRGGFALPRVGRTKDVLMLRAIRAFCGLTAPIPPIARVTIALFVSPLEPTAIHAPHVARSIAAVVGVSILPLPARIVPVPVPRVVPPPTIAVLIALIVGLPLDAVAAIRAGSGAIPPLAVRRCAGRQGQADSQYRDGFQKHMSLLNGASSKGSTIAGLQVFHENGVSSRRPEPAEDTAASDISEGD